MSYAAPAPVPTDFLRCFVSLYFRRANRVGHGGARPKHAAAGVHDPAVHVVVAA